MTQRHAPRHSAARARAGWIPLAAAGACLVLAGTFALVSGDGGAPADPVSTPRTQEDSSGSTGGAEPSLSGESLSSSPSSTATVGGAASASTVRTDGATSPTPRPASTTAPEPAPVQTTAPAPSATTPATKRPKPTPPGATNRPTKTPK